MILLDSIEGRKPPAVALKVRALVDWERDNATKPSVTVTAHYTPHQRPVPRELWTTCDAAMGATLRVNGALISSLSVTIGAGGSVSVEFRRINGARMMEPIQLRPGDPGFSIDWPTVTKGTD